MRLVPLLLGAIAAMVATPAAATDLAGLDCPLAALSDAQRNAAGEALVASAGPNDARVEVVRAAAEACARQLGWTGRASDLATAYHVTGLARDILRQRLTAAGIDLAPLERAVVEDPVLLAAMGPDHTDAGAMREFAERHRDLIETMLRGRTPEIQNSVGAFAGFVLSAYVMRRGFAAN